MTEMSRSGDMRTWGHGDIKLRCECCRASPWFSSQLSEHGNQGFHSSRCLWAVSTRAPHWSPRYPWSSEPQEARADLQRREAEWILLHRPWGAPTGAVFTPVQLSTRSLLLTDNLQIDTCCVLHVFNLHVEIVLPRVFSLRLADEQDGVQVAVPHASERGV